MNITELSSRVTRQAPNCPGGVGNFGFNSYDLMTFGLLAMGAVSSAVIINTNKNENNNNNNDLQASIGGLTTNVQMSSADQTTTQMATITVPPTGVPVVVPAGRLYFDGRIELLPKLEVPGVSWENEEFQVFDDGLMIEKGKKNGTESIRHMRGIVAFGTIDDRNIFHLLPPLKNGKLIDWDTIRQMANGGKRVGKSENPPVIPFDDTPVFVPSEELDNLFDKAVQTQGLTLVQIAAPPLGPPIIIPIGALLETGNVLLNDGIEIEGIFWESEDRILHPNGTIEYKLTGKSEKAKIAFGTVDDQGKIQLLPKLGKHKTSLSLFKDLNVKPNSRNVRTSINKLADNELFRVRDRLKRMKRNTNHNMDTINQDLEQSHLISSSIKSAFSTSAMLHELNITNADYWSELSMCETYNSVNMLDTILPLIKPEYTCFVSNVIEYCRDLVM